MGHVSGSLRRVGKRILNLAGGLSFAAMVCAGATEPRVAELYLAEAPPLSQLGQAGNHGIVGEVTVKAASLAGYDLHLVSIPWSRAQLTVRSNRDYLIIPLSRTPDREASYTWIAPIATMDRAFFSLDQRVDTFDQARRTFKRIAVGRGSAQEQKLRDEGFSEEQIYPLKIGDNPAQMLLLGRVDAWFNGVPETLYIWPEVSDRPLRMSPALMVTDLYLACSKTCDERMVRRLKAAVEGMRRDGTIQRLLHAGATPGVYQGIYDIKH